MRDTRRRERLGLGPRSVVGARSRSPQRAAQLTGHAGMLRRPRSSPSIVTLWARDALTEQDRVEALPSIAPDLVRLERVATVPCRDRSFPLYACHVGAENRERPVFGLFGGVHGIERIGSHVVLSFLESLLERLRWDKEARRMLRKCRLVAMPVVNPGGMWLRTRANPRGVDLMRNAPVEAEVRTPFLIGGQRWSRRLPWYRGTPGQLEIESQAVVDLVEREIFPARAALTLDVHSGFGSTDRLWFPYAKTTAPFPSLEQVTALADLLGRSYPHHVYRIEQQSDAYTTSGDLWDHLYDRHRAAHPERLFVPWTLEIGSWAWVRKDPRQLFARRGAGVFNPLRPHRYDRAMRRHLLLLDLFLRSVRNHRRWSGPSAAPDDRSEQAPPGMGDDAT
jgi:hypothetical protein